MAAILQLAMDANNTIELSDLVRVIEFEITTVERDGGASFESSITRTAVVRIEPNDIAAFRRLRGADFAKWMRSAWRIDGATEAGINGRQLDLEITEVVPSEKQIRSVQTQHGDGLYRLVITTKDKLLLAEDHLKAARDILVQAPAPKSAEKVRSAIKSVGGAIRHNDNRAYRADELKGTNEDLDQSKSSSAGLLARALGAKAGVCRDLRRS